MAGSPSVAIKTAAKRIGIAEASYRENLAKGLKWCHECSQWHERTKFTSDSSRGDGLSPSCANSRNEKHRKKYIKKPRPLPGRSFVKRRDGDKKQARSRVNYLRKIKLLPDPNSIPCCDCGHVGKNMRHEYDHYLGYAKEHHEHVHAVCTKCHAKRARDRGEIVQVRSSSGKFKCLRPRQ
jgi:hypothetical protein